MTLFRSTATVLADVDERFADTYPLNNAFFSNPKDIFDIIESPYKTADEVEMPKTVYGMRNVADFFVYRTPNYVRETPFISLQKWEGVVTTVSKNTFHAKLVDLNSEDDELAEIPKAEVNDEDLLLLKPGSIFYWNIGYSFTAGTKTRASLIRFKRMPKLTRKQEEEAKRRASALLEKIKWGEGARD